LEGSELIAMTTSKVALWESSQSNEIYE
jgi:hypothetical protein